MKTQSAADVQAAEFVAQADVNFWTKRALAFERQADRATTDVKRLKTQMMMVDKAKERL